MKADCVKEKLKNAVMKVEKITGKHLSLPILNSILIEAGDQSSIPAKVEKKGVVAVSGSLLGNFLSATADSQSIKLEVINGNLCVTSESNTTIIKGYPTEDFPTIPRVEEGETFNISAPLAVQGFRSVSYAAAISDIKPEIASVYLFGDKESVVFVSTDAFRLAEKTVNIDEPAKDLSALIVPLKNTLEIVRVLDGITDKIEMQFNKNQISFTGAGIYLTSRLVNGVFPNYKQLIPAGKKTEVTVSKKDLANSLKLATLFSDKFNQVTVKVIVNDQLFEIQSQNAETGENTTKINATLDGEDVELSFNARYVQDSFQSIPEDNISLTFNGAGKPMVMRGVGNPTFVYLVMPMIK
jgi:DNA polymerase III subunit beta